MKVKELINQLKELPQDDDILDTAMDKILWLEILKYIHLMMMNRRKK